MQPIEVTIEVNGKKQTIKVYASSKAEAMAQVLESTLTVYAVPVDNRDFLF